MEPGSAPTRSAPPEAAIKSYYRTVVDHLWLVILCVVLTVGVAAAYVTVAPRKYQAQAQMLVSPVPSSASTLIGLPVLHASNDPVNDVLTAANLMTTSDVARAVIGALHLNESPSALLGQVQATPIGQSNLVALQVTGSSAEQAQTIANEFAQQIVATRSAALHRAIAALIPSLQTQLARVPPGQRNGPGTIGDQLSQLQQLLNSPDPSITVAALATRPTGPYTPNTKLALGAGLLAGLLLGIFAAFAVGALDPRLRRADQLRKLLDAPVMTRIPRVNARNGRPMLPEDIPEPAAESYRTLRTVLQARANGKPRLILVTGSAPSEGKTTSAINVAAALAQGGSRVTLIEIDMRRPTISRALWLEPTYGTEDVLAGAADFHEALLRVTFEGVPLQVLAVRHPGTELSNRISSRTVQRLVDRALEISDFVVVDSPPLAAVSDALPLAMMADERLIVARVGKSTLARLAELNELLADQGSPPTGVVVVGESARQFGDYYYTSWEAGQ